MKKLVLEEDLNDKMLPFVFDLKTSDLVIVNSLESINILRSSSEDCSIVGIDTETKPMFVKQKYRTMKNNPTSLLQIAIRNDRKEIVLIVDLLELDRRKYLKQLDSALLSMFRKKSCIKVGQSLENDFKELRKSYPSMECFHEINGLMETTVFYRFLQPEIKYNVSLKFLVKTYLNFNLVKSQQMSDWSIRPLTHHQIHYAACDALVLLRLYDTMCCEAEEQSSIDQKEFDVVKLLKDVKVPDGIMKPKSINISASKIVSTPKTEKVIQKGWQSEPSNISNSNKYLMDCIETNEKISKHLFFDSFDTTDSDKETTIVTDFNENKQSIEMDSSKKTSADQTPSIISKKKQKNFNLDASADKIFKKKIKK